MVPASAYSRTGADTLTVIGANDNRVAGGTSTADTRRIALVARRGRWHPEGDEGSRLLVEAFGEEGLTPTIPGPLIRVLRGTRVQAVVRNALPDTLVVRGLAGGDSAAIDSLVVAPGRSAAAHFVAVQSGTYIYWGTTRHGSRTRPRGTGGQLVGALVVDTLRTPPDRVFVISYWDSSPDGTAGANDAFAFVINGKSWPHTERLRFATGDTVHWRWINASRDEHPMHLHGFYFRVDARGHWAADTTYAVAQRRLAVTETLLPMTTMSVAWSPDRPGNWVFHCHITAHITGDMRYLIAGRPAPARPLHLTHGRHAEEGMAGLVMGLEVSGRALAAVPVTRHLRLLVQERPRVYGANPGFGYVLASDGPDPDRDSLSIPGPMILLTAGERSAITVVNHLREPTSVHWHGLELDSYNDGVPDWSGSGQIMAPPIAPNDSFRAQLMTPRAGTFMYHAHVEEGRQIGSGLYGPLIVLEPGQRWDPVRDHVLLLGEGGPDSTARVELNGSRAPNPITLRAGITHRLRVINITTEAPTELTLRGKDTLVEWRAVAKDGAELPPSQANMRPARIAMGPGETADFEITPEVGMLWIEVRAYGEFAFRVPVIVR